MDEASVAEKTRRGHEYREYLAFMAGADEELQATRGYGMLPSEREEYTFSFYAEEYRAEIRKLA